VVGGWGEIEIKAKLSPAEVGVWTELGNKSDFIYFNFIFEKFNKHTI
jgi:hypothetical protein